MHKKEKFIIFLIVLFARTVFLFVDAFFSSSQKKSFQDGIQENIQQYVISQNTKIHASADTHKKQIKLEKQNTSVDMVQKKLKQGLDFTAEKISKISKSIKNLDILEKIYQTKQDPEILQALVQKLVGEYQFAKAKEYIADINIFTDKIIDAKTFLYTNINLLSSTDKGSMEKFMSFVDQMRYKGLVSSDDYLFYQGIAKLWHKDYKGGLEVLSQVDSPSYSNFISQLKKSLDTFEAQKGVPGYYNDALIALVAMKNGYFSLANKLALSAVIANPEYILPHQVLAYSSFLTHNRDRSIENFYDLIELDEDNQDKYNFYIGLAYYRGGQYQKSISTLSQLVDAKEYKTDVYRYLLLNYEKVGDQSKMIKVWQQLLGQDDLQDSDFRHFYDLVFYRPFSENKQYTIYKKYRQLSYDFVSMCYENLGQKNDTCLYGEAGLDILNEDRQSVKTSLLYLSENYPQASIFQALGDYYKAQNLEQKAKIYYLKAASLVDNISQKSVIEDRLMSEID